MTGNYQAGEEMTNLYINLKRAYTEENLNLITAKIVGLYKAKQYSNLKDLLKVIDGEKYNDLKISKCFSTLLMLYHPDKLSYYLKEIEESYKNKEKENLEGFSHIFAALDMENVIVLTRLNAFEEDFASEYVWDYEQTGYSYYSDIEETNPDYDDYGSDTLGYEDEFENFSEIIENGFYSAVKRKIYGSKDIELPAILLEDLEDIDMAEYEIENLDGIDCCKHLINLDLSNNKLTDITELYHLKNLQEIYLANNQIGYIDALGFIKNLRVVDLSHNEINDLTPLFQLPKLEYVNVLGNKIPVNQKDFLKNRGVIVVD